MTAKHRRPKSNHKHEENAVKSEAVESEVGVGASNHSLHLVLFLMIVVGGVTGTWFCFQQHRTLTHLTDSLAGMQMKIVKLQSHHEQMRQSSEKQYVSEGVESRLNALEESYALTQKQVAMAQATAEQLRDSDLPSQVLSLHTQMKARVAETQQSAVSLEQLSHLQTTVNGKSEEMEAVRVQVEGLATLGADLSQRVEVLTGSLEERVGQVAALSAALDGQAAEVLRLKEQQDTHQAQLEASTLEIASVRDLLESEQAQRLQQASMEEQLNTVRQRLQDQTAAARYLTAGLKAQLESIQKQLVGEDQLSPEPEENSEAETAPADEEEELPAADLEKEASIPEEADGGEATEEGVEEESSVPEESEEATEEEVLPIDVENEASIPGEAQADGGEATEEDVEEEASIPEEREEASEEEALPIDVENEASIPDGEAAAATEEEEEEMPPADVEEEASSTDEEAGEGGEAAAQDEAPVEEDSVTEEDAPAEKVEAVETDQSEEEEGDLTQTAEEEQSVEEEEEEEVPEEEASESPEIQEESAPLEEEENLDPEEEVSEWEEEEQDMADEEEPSEDDSVTEDECKKE